MDNWTYKDIVDFYNRVRAELNNVSNTSLTDEQIDFPEKARFAELLIKNIIDNWEELKNSTEQKDIDKFGLFESCIVIQTAIYFEDYVDRRQPNKMKSSSLEIQYQETGESRSALTLAEKLNERLSLIQDDVVTSFFGFRATNVGV